MSKITGDFCGTREGTTKERQEILKQNTRQATWLFRPLGFSVFLRSLSPLRALLLFSMDASVQRHAHEDEDHASERKHTSPCHLASKWSRYGSRRATGLSRRMSQADDDEEERQLFLEHESAVRDTRAQPPESSVSRIFPSYREVARHFCREPNMRMRTSPDRETFVLPVLLGTGTEDRRQSHPSIVPFRRYISFIPKTKRAVAVSFFVRKSH